MAKLIVLKGGTPTTHQLSDESTTLGRGGNCDFVLVARGVSRRHAVVRKEDLETYVLEDLGSVNGTYVNGNRVAKPHILKDQDRIKIGSYLIRFEDDAPDALPGSHRQTWSADEDDGSLLGIKATVTGGYLSKKGEKGLGTWNGVDT